MVAGFVDPSVAAVFVGFWIGMSFLWTPFLAARGVRRLLSRWPTTRLPINYALAMGGVTAAHFVAVLGGLFAVTQAGSANLVEVFGLTTRITGGFVAVLWTGLSVGLPRAGLWEPRGEGWDGRLVLAGGALWYLCCTAIIAGLLNFLAFVFAFPG